jgi:hypothetical protein
MENHMSDDITLTLRNGAVLPYTRAEAGALTERLWGISTFGGAAPLATQISQAMRASPLFLRTIQVSSREESALRFVLRRAA